MRKLSILFLVLICSFTAKAQIALNYDDTLICRGNTITMGAALTGQVNGLDVDDYFTDEVIDIGFPFEFYGNTYTKCVISGNGFLSFDTTLATEHSDYIYQDAVNDNEVDNAVLFGFMDTDLGVSGTLKYQTFGSPGNRRFVVEFCKVPKYGFQCNQYTVTNQVILYEGSNIIEYHTADMPGTPTCPGVSQGEAVQGIRYVDGTTIQELFTPGRQPNGPWGSVGCTNSSYRYTPTTATPFYTIDSIPFDPWAIIENIYNSELKWYDANGTFLGQGATMTVTPTNPPIPAPGTFYTVEYVGKAGCDTSVTYTFKDTVNVHYDDKHNYITAEICGGEVYNYLGRILHNPGTYDTLFPTAALGCDSITTLTLIVNPLPDVTLNELNKVKMCQGDIHPFRAVKTPGATYQWLNNGAPISGATSDTFNATTAGNYSVAIKTNKGCTDTSKVVQLIINPNPTVNINYVSKNDICSMDTITLRATASGNNLEYVWTPDEYFRRTSTSQYNEVTAVVPESGYIKVKVFNGDLCSASDSVWINTHPCCEIGKPNAFTPNNDGKNDYFAPILQVGQTLVSFQIFNRRGQLIYDGNNPKGWNGKDKNGNDVANDVYVYRIEYNCSDGKLYTDKGDVTVMR